MHSHHQKHRPATKGKSAEIPVLRALQHRRFRHKAHRLPADCLITEKRDASIEDAEKGAATGLHPGQLPDRRCAASQRAQFTRAVTLNPPNPGEIVSNPRSGPLPITCQKHRKGHLAGSLNVRRRTSALSPSPRRTLRRPFDFRRAWGRGAATPRLLVLLRGLEIIQNFGRVNRKEYKGRRRGR